MRRNYVLHVLAGYSHVEQGVGLAGRVSISHLECIRNCMTTSFSITSSTQ